METVKAYVCSKEDRLRWTSKMCVPNNPMTVRRSAPHGGWGHLRTDCSAVAGNGPAKGKGTGKGPEQSSKRRVWNQGSGKGS